MIVKQRTIEMLLPIDSAAAAVLLLAILRTC